MFDRIEDAYLSRRAAVAGALGAGLAAVAGVGIGAAQDQDETATPAATPDASPAAETEDEDGDVFGAEALVAEAIERAEAAIAAAQADRDAVAGQIDPAQVDELLARATSVLDRARAAGSAEPESALRLALAAGATARTAGDLVEAGLISAGLPSQEARASRVLAAAHGRIDAIGEETAAATEADADASAYLTSAQDLYGAAYELYGGGAYARAAVTARAAVELAEIAAFLSLPEEFGVFPGRRVGLGPGGGVGRGDRPERGDRLPGLGRGGERGIDRDGEADEPVEVPEPTF